MGADEKKKKNTKKEKKNRSSAYSIPGYSTHLLILIL
jgi:hypothetical protein